MFDQNDQSQAPVNTTTPTIAADPAGLPVPPMPDPIATAPAADLSATAPAMPDPISADPTTQAVPDLSGISLPSDPAPAMPDPIASAPTQDETSPSDTSSSDTENGDLISIKQDALQSLTPLLSQLEQTPEEKFRTTMMLIQASDDQSLVQAAYAAAKDIPDEKVRAQALLDIVNEINYFTQSKSAGQ